MNLKTITYHYHYKGVIVENINGREFCEAKVVIATAGTATVMHREGVPTVEGKNYMTYIAHWYNMDMVEKLRKDRDACAFRKWMNTGSDMFGNSHPEGMYMISCVTEEGITKCMIEGKKSLLQKISQRDRQSFDIMTIPDMPQLRFIRRIVGASDFCAIDHYIGGHPGFNVPFEKDTVFEDYYLEFDSVRDVKRVGFSEDCFVTEELTDFALVDGVRLPLSHDLFDDDAIVLTDMASSVILKSKTGVREIKVSYSNMSYLGIWHMPKTDAPYIFIDPWSSLPSRKYVIVDLSMQPGLISLRSKCEYENEFTIIFYK